MADVEKKKQYRWTWNLDTSIVDSSKNKYQFGLILDNECGEFSHVYSWTVYIFLLYYSTMGL